MKHTATIWKVVRRIVFHSTGVIVGLMLLWFGGHMVEWVTGIRILPWNLYALIANSSINGFLNAPRKFTSGERTGMGLDPRALRSP